MTRGVVAASVAAAAGFTAVAAWAQPGRAKTVDSNRSLGAGSATPATVLPTVSPTTSGSDDVPATTPATYAPVDNGNGGGYTSDTLAPPDTLPDPGYSYSPPVVSGAS